MRESISAPSKTTLPLLAMLVVSLLLSVGISPAAFGQAVPLGSKTRATSQSRAAEHRNPTHPHRKPAASTPETLASTSPPAPPIPKWPVNESPSRPKVKWDSRGLAIDASNASLHQILNEVATLTGAKVEGFGADERVFGNYGPGQARDVLSQLLHGTGYNVLMFGDQGQGTPREIVLSPRRDAGNQAPAMNNPRGMNPSGMNSPEPENTEDDEPQQPVIDEQQPSPPMLSTPSAPRTPQQIMLEMQQRQQELQRQQQQQNNPPPQ